MRVDIGQKSDTGFMLNLKIIFVKHFQWSNWFIFIGEKRRGWEFYLHETVMIIDMLNMDPILDLVPEASISEEQMFITEIIKSTDHLQIHEKLRNINRL